MAAQAIQAFEPRYPVIVNPSEIRAGDWMHDLGTPRQVDYVDTFGVGAGSGVVHIVHFKPQEGVENLVRGISAGMSLTVWRTSPEPDSEAVGHAHA